MAAAAARGNEASKRAILETQRVYADLISRPLDEKQLARPTFKFIQEIVKSLITETRTLRKVFNPSDFGPDSKSWDKRRKTDFIQRLIDFAANHKQPVVGCVAAKLVAGLEPNKTNELLQSLAKIARARLAGQDAATNASRPRTFIRQLSGSVSPPKQQPPPTPANDGEMVVKKPTSSRAAQQVAGSRARTSVIRAGQEEPAPAPRRKISTDTKPVATAGPNGGSQPDRDLSASSSGVGGSRRTSERANSATSNRMVSSSSKSTKQITDSRATVADGVDVGSSGGDQESRTAAMALTDDEPIIMRQSLANKAAVPRTVITSESDINKNIPQLRSNLRQLRSILMDINQLETGLKLKLTGQFDHN